MAPLTSVSWRRQARAPADNKAIASVAGGNSVAENTGKISDPNGITSSVAGKSSAEGLPTQTDATVATLTSLPDATPLQEAPVLSSISRDIKQSQGSISIINPPETHSSSRASPTTAINSVSPKEHTLIASPPQGPPSILHSALNSSISVIFEASDAPAPDPSNSTTHSTSLSSTSTSPGNESTSSGSQTNAPGAPTSSSASVAPPTTTNPDPRPPDATPGGSGTGNQGDSTGDNEITSQTSPPGSEPSMSAPTMAMSSSVSPPSEADTVNNVVSPSAPTTSNSPPSNPPPGHAVMANQATSLLESMVSPGAGSPTLSMTTQMVKITSITTSFSTTTDSSGTRAIPITRTITSLSTSVGPVPTSVGEGPTRPKQTNAAITGGIIGTVILVLAILLIAWCLVRRRRRKEEMRAFLIASPDPFPHSARSSSQTTDHTYQSPLVPQPTHNDATSPEMVERPRDHTFNTTTVIRKKPVPFLHALDLGAENRLSIASTSSSSMYLSPDQALSHPKTARDPFADPLPNPFDDPRPTIPTVVIHPATPEPGDYVVDASPSSKGYGIAM